MFIAADLLGLTLGLWEAVAQEILIVVIGFLASVISQCQILKPTFTLMCPSECEGVTLGLKTTEG